MQKLTLIKIFKLNLISCLVFSSIPHLTSAVSYFRKIYIFRKTYHDKNKSRKEHLFVLSVYKHKNHWIRSNVEVETKS